MQFAWLIPSILFGVYLGSTSGVWHMLVMSLSTAVLWLGVKKFNDSRSVDLSDPVVIIGSEVWIGDYQLPRYEIFWKQQWHALVYAAFKAKQSQPNFELQLGLESHVGHGIIIGPTGSGKSELIKLLLVQLLKNQPACELTLIDFKGGATFNQFENLAQTKELVTDVDGHDPETFWQSVRAEIGRRELALAAAGVSRIEDIIEISRQLPRRYILVDELATALAESPLAQSALIAVAARGRSLGIHLLVATQSAQGVPRALLTNLRARIALADADPIELAQLSIKRPSEPDSTPPGWARGILQKSSEPAVFFYFPIGVKI